MLNQLLGGHYRVVQNLQEGGLAKTYIAEDHHRPGHPKCAVKLLKPVSNQPEFLLTARRLFKQEAEILEKLGQHNQIPRLLAYFEENQEFYLVQEFIEGHTLSTELPQGHRWSESKVIQMLQNVLQILQFVHSYGVIHRDIKPNNLIRRQKDGRLVLIDFGAVKQVSAPQMNNHSPLTQKTITIGTQGYMPIEQVRGKPRLNSDIYALGMIGIQALTGVHPLYFREDEEGEVIWQDLTQVSDELATILTNMVRSHFKDRYQSTIEVLQALQPLAAHYGLIQTNSDTRQESLEVEPESELREKKISPNLDTLIPWNLEAVTEALLPETKVVPDIKQPSSELEPETELQETKATLGLAQPTPEITNNEKTWQFWMILRNQLTNYGYLSILSWSRQFPFWRFFARSCDQQKKVILASPAGSLAPSEDLEVSHDPIFVRLNKSQLLIGTGITSVLVGILTGYSYINNSYLQAERALEQIEELKADEKYQECVRQARTFPQDYLYLQAEVETLLNQCHQAQAEGQLAEARKLAEQSRLEDAIALAAQVPVDTDLHPEAQQLMSEWSEQIFQIASNKYQEGNLQEAIAIAEAVPADNPLAQKVQATIQQWNEEWQQNQTHLQTAQKAQDEGRWQDAINAAKKVSQTAYWQKQSEPIIRKAKAEIAAAQAAASRKTSQPRSSSTSPRSRLFPRSLSNSLRSKSVTSSTSPRSRSVPRSLSNPARSKSSDWICLNNPNPKCHK